MMNEITSVYMCQRIEESAVGNDIKDNFKNEVVDL